MREGRGRDGRGVSVDPEVLKRQSTLDEIDRKINRDSKFWYDYGLDPGINEVCVGLNAVMGGFSTVMSCEGHEDDIEAVPWVGFNSTYHTEDGEETQLHELQELIEEFYKERDVPEYLRLGIYRGIGGARSGQYTLTTTLGAHLRVSRDDSDRKRARACLEDQQREMADFGQFLKDKFLSGFTIEIDEYDWGDDDELDYPDYWDDDKLK